MDPDVIAYLQGIGNVVLGAVLRLASARWTDWWNDRKKVRTMTGAIRRELRETAHRLVSVAYTLNQRHGGFNRELLQWMQTQIERYDGPNRHRDMLAAVGTLLRQSDERLAEIAKHSQATMEPQSVVREEPAYTGLDRDGSRLRTRLCQARSRRARAHPHAERGPRRLALLRVTFTPGLLEENHRRALQGNIEAEKMIALRARIVVDKIAELEEHYPEKG